jgi:hypothetical protein
LVQNFGFDFDYNKEWLEEEVEVFFWLSRY